MIAMIPFTVKADWTLHLHKEGESIYLERFIGLSDCVARAEKSMHLLFIHGIRSTFSCDLREEEDAKEDTAIPQVPGVDNS